MKRKYNWGIIGLGSIANKFAQDLALCTDAILYNVASRDVIKARSFSKKYNAIKFSDSYLDLVNDPSVDIVYIATPHSFHFEHTMMCLRAGKSVLCEKPMGLNSFEVEAMTAEAKRRGVFLMEGLWTRFVPATQKVIDVYNDGLIGEIKEIKADFGFKAEVDLNGRLYNKSLGGGSLMDIGIYPIYLSLLLLGKPKSIIAEASFTSSGVDESCTIIFEYENDARAHLYSDITKETPTQALILATKGEIKIHPRFHHSKRISITSYNGIREDLVLDYSGHGYCDEILEVMKCIDQGKKESIKLPVSVSLDLITILDEIKKKIGLAYNDKCR